MRHFSSFIDGFKEFCGDAEAPEKWIRWSALSAVAGALERKVWLTNGLITWYPNLYVFIVGDAGAGKSTVAESAMGLLGDVPEVTFLPNQLNIASFIKSMNEVSNVKKFEWEGKSFKHSAAMLFASEAADAFGEMYSGGGIIPIMTSLYNGGQAGWSNTHAFTRSTMSGGKVTLFNPCINMLACTTPIWLTTKVMTESDAEGGFGSRVILVVNKGMAHRKSFGFREATFQMGVRRVRLVEDLQRIAKLQGPYTVDVGFREATARHEREHHEQMNSKGSGKTMLAGYRQRKFTHAMKLSMVIAASESDELLLRADHFDRAWAMLTELEPDMAAAFKKIKQKSQHDSQAERDARNQQEVVEYITNRRKNRISRQEIMMAMSDRLSVKFVGSVLDSLVMSGILKLDRQGSTAATTFYDITPEFKDFKGFLSEQPKEQ